MKAFYTTQDISLEPFSVLCSRSVDTLYYPSALSIEKKVVIYEGNKLLGAIDSSKQKLALQEELYHCLKEGPGVFVIRGFYDDTEVVDRSNELFHQIIQEEKKQRSHAGDHFAKAGENERIWNSFQKVCEKDPQAFIDYYKNPLYALVSESWLGPGYQLTAQVNIVKPGGSAQSAHRDYHLGFQRDEQVSRFPLSLQVASQYLTLQGGIAHSDMSLSSGPTLLLPFSQQYELGYLAWRDKAFRAYFETHAIQLPLAKGDAIFFSPALFHAAGTNKESTDRSANLIQVSAAFGKPMEDIDRGKLMRLTYPVLQQNIEAGLINEQEMRAVVAAIADGYAFPTNLDVVQPVGGAAPETAQDVFSRAMKSKWSTTQLDTCIRAHLHDRKA